MRKNNYSERNSDFIPNSLFRGGINPNSLKNLKPYKKGQTGNPNGRPLGKKNFDTIFNTALEIFEVNGNEDQQIEIFKQLIKKARNGDVRAICLFMDIYYGKLD